MIVVPTGIQNPGSLCDGFRDKAIETSGKMYRNYLTYTYICNHGTKIVREKILYLFILS